MVTAGRGSGHSQCGMDGNQKSSRKTGTETGGLIAAEQALLYGPGLVT